MAYRLTTRPRKIKFAREAGAVRRLHVHRVLGSYDIGQHTFNTLCLLRLLNPEADRELIWQMLTHDMPERLTGDIPAPAKWEGGWFDAASYQMVEEDILYGTGFGSDFDLSDENAKWLKFCDAVELYLSCLDQEMMGNQTLWRVKNNIWNFIERSDQDWPEEAWKFWQELKKDDWLMTKEINEDE